MNELRGNIEPYAADQTDLLQEALEAIERLQRELDRRSRPSREPIAIIGAGCRYPGGVTDPEGLWRLIQSGTNAIGEIPEDRWDVQNHLHPTPGTPGKMYANKGGFLADVESFDALFFAITPREAEFLDPQQRLLLESAYEAIESAAIAVDSLAGTRTGVFVGGPSPDFGHRLQRLSAAHSNLYQVNGAGLHAGAGRLSYTFGLNGPCVAIDTACSTSLVAVHLACQSLRAGESDLALAGGASILLGPFGAILFSQGHLMAPDGQCKTFDASADGFVRSEGCSVLALKRLADAERDGDPILGVIRGTAVNSDGRSAGLTQPYGPAQEAVIRTALADAGLEPTDIDYVEAHGTGTPTGDPIEVEALVNVLGEGRSADTPLLLGSIKTNIGHPEAASGVAGLLKVVKALEHEEIPPSLHFNDPNPHIEWDRHPIMVASESQNWPFSKTRPRRAGISSFGFSGTNAHVIVEEVPARPERPPLPAGPHLVGLSAKTPKALTDLAARHADYIAANPDLELADVALTLGAGREGMPKRLALIADDTADLERLLRLVAAGETPLATAQGSAGEAPRIAFLFTGQGSQYAGMGRALYASEPVFRAMLDHAAEVLDPLLERPFLEVLFADAADAALINETAYTQPALFAIEVALAELWRSWGVTPTIVVGHSIGEFSAACVAGVFSFEDGLKLVAERGRLMQALPRGGAMAAFFANETQVAAALTGFEDRLSIAGINGPEETVVSGDAAALAQVAALLEAKGIGHRPLDVSHAFHSPLLEPMLAEFEARAAGITYNPPEITLVSNVTGEPFPYGVGPDAAYWRRHARQAVRFAPSLSALEEAQIDMLVEVGPTPILLGLAARAIPGAAWKTVASLRPNRDDDREMLAAARDLYVAGAKLDWLAMPAGRVGRRIVLPTYPFQRKRHWVIDQVANRRFGMPSHHLLGQRVPGPGPDVSFLKEITLSDPGYLAQHLVHGTAIMPGAGMMEVMFAAGRAVGMKDEITLEQVVFRAPVRIQPDETIEFHTLMVREDDHWQVTLRSADAGLDFEDQDWVVHAQARVRPGTGERTNDAAAAAEVRPRALKEINMPDYYADNLAKGLELGPMFQVVQQEHMADEFEVVSRLDLSPAVAFDPFVNIHPVMLDGAIQVTGSFVMIHSADKLHIPIGVDEITLHRSAPSSIWVSGKLVEIGGDATMLRYDVRLEDTDGAPVVTMTGLISQAVSAQSMGAGIRPHRLVPQWQAQKSAAQGASTLPGKRVLIADRDGFAEQLAEAIAERGGSATVIEPDALEETLASGGNLAMVIDCTALDSAAPGNIPGRVEDRYLALLSRAQLLAARAPKLPLCIMTQGAIAALPSDTVNLDAAPLVGLSRALAAEHMLAPRLRIDLDPATAPVPRLVATALASLSAENPEVALRSGALLAQRLKPMPAPQEPDAGSATVLTITERGDFDQLRFEQQPRRTPGDDEVEIEVRAVGLNFRDLINALGMYPAPVPPLGSEAAGVITRVGSGVTDLQVGDEVVSIAPASFASHCLAPRPLVVRKPANISFADAATIPNTYLTAKLCFEVAGLKCGQRVLIHAAAGGVGSAALRLAKLAGLEIFATAGNDAKRAFVRESGADHVFDSRSTAFADEIMAVTNGEGVDLVINSLAGDFIEAGLRIVRDGGCFVEIGKQGLWTEEQVARVAPGVRYRIEDLGASVVTKPLAVQADFEELMALAAAGEIAPLPVEAFPLSAAKQAFRHMANAKHTGKIVLLPDEWSPPLDVRDDATYLVTGGLGGIGLKVVRALLERGAGRVVSVSRNGGAGHDGLLAELGDRVTPLACDIADRAAVERLWREDLQALPPLRGIIHSAGVLADAVLEEQDAAKFETVRRPKVDGAWNLHCVSGRQPLDFFVLFSSTAALFGSAGQANYAAANAFLDGLATYRKFRGLPATTIAWGPWADVGMASGMAAQRETWARGGIGMLEPEQGIEALEAILSTPVTYAAVTSMDLKMVGRSSGPAMAAMLGVKVRAGSDVEVAKASFSSPHLDAFKALGRDADTAARQAVLRSYLRDEVARVLAYEADALDPQTSLNSLGLDSLMAVQLRNTIAAHLGVDVPVKELLQGHSVNQLTEVITALLLAKAGGGEADEGDGLPGTNAGEPDDGQEEGVI